MAKLPTRTSSCGTRAGYKAHGRRGETACPACKQANTRYVKDRAKKAKPAGTKAAGSKATATKKAKPIAAPSLVDPLDLMAPEDDPGNSVPPTVEELEEAKQRQHAATPAPTPTPAPAPTVPTLDPDAPQPPRFLKEAGLELWRAVTAGYELNPAALTLLGEACRTADKLERFAAALNSKSALWFELPDPADLPQGAEEFPIVVNGMIGESRQLQNQIRQTLGQLGIVEVQLRADAAEAPSITDQLAARRAARLAKQQAEAEAQ